MFFCSTYIMDDLALAEVASGSLTGDNFGDLKGASFDSQLVVNTAFAPKIRKRQPASNLKFEVQVGGAQRAKNPPNFFFTEEKEGIMIDSQCKPV